MSNGLADARGAPSKNPAAQAVLLTTDAAFARAVAESMQRMMQDTLPPDSASVPDNGFLITVPDLETAAEIANRKAPEHLELAMNPGPARDKLAASLRNYGSLFTGHRSAEVLGDYAAGLNHTLPTAGAAAFTGGLSVRHFLKTVTTLRAGETPDADLSGWEASARAAETLAEAEGLTGQRPHSACAAAKPGGVFFLKRRHTAYKRAGLEGAQREPGKYKGKKQSLFIHFTVHPCFILREASLPVAVSPLIMVAI